MSGKDQDNNAATEQLEEWMNVWQSQVDPIDELREDFLTRTHRVKRMNYIVIGWLLFCCGVLLTRAILYPEAFTIA
ncbi:MAG: hypothetical protein VX475_06850, partial [Myxococcota bacterium]|nr:hypothetical protein [Myxococcota bacterium]